MIKIGMEALVSQTPKSLKTPRNSRSNTTRLQELWPEGSYQLSPSLIPLDRVPEGACQENHQTIVPCSLPQQLPSTPGLFSSLKLHPSGFQGTDKASAHPPGLHTVFHGLHNFLLLFPKETPLRRAGSWAEKLCQCPEYINLISAGI